MRPIESLLADAVAALQAGWWKEALPLLEQAYRIDPRRPETLINLGLAHLHLGSAQQAVSVLKRAVAVRPDLPQAHVNLGLALSATGRHKDAIASLTRAVRLAPANARTHYDLATVCHSAGQPQPAIAAFREALRLQPDLIEAWFNLGNLLHAAGDVQAAEQSWRTGLGSAPDHLPSWLNLGALLLGAGRFADALACFERALVQDPTLAVGHNGCGNALHAIDRLDEALAAYARAASLDPDAAEIRYNLGNQQLQLGLVDEALASFQRVLIIDPVHAEAAQNLLLSLNYSDRSAPAEVTELHRQFATVVAPPVAMLAASAFPGHTQGQPARSPRDAASPVMSSIAGGEHSVSTMADGAHRIRLGFVSADFRTHSVAWFLLPLLDALDRDRFEVTCYSNVARPDAITDRIRVASDRWRDIHGLPDIDALARVSEDKIDVLVDLSGHTAGQRLGLFARRAAPSQLSWLGYPNTTGHPSMDARLVDAVTDPQHPAVHAFASEALIRMHGCFVCYQPPAGTADARRLTPSRGDNDALAFGSFNNLAKVTASTIALWAGALSAVPRSTLLLKATGMEQPGVQQRLAVAFDSHGIDAARIRFLPREPTLEGHLACYGQVDIALDTWPYHGTTTTCEALAMGVPVVTCIGDRHASRVGASLLAAAGVPQWATDCEAAFAERAAALADEIRSGQWPRDRLQQQVDASALCDAPAFAEAFAQALAEAMAPTALT